METKKRVPENAENGSPAKLTESKKRAEKLQLTDDEGFEDQFEDEFEEEEFVADDDDLASKDENDSAVREELEAEIETRPWRPGVDPIGTDEELLYDPSVYDMYHRAMLDWSCLSFDIVSDQLGMCRDTYPHVAYLVAGTQAEETSKNTVTMMKWSNLTRTKRKADDDDDAISDDSSDDDAEGGLSMQPRLDFRAIQHTGTVNRVRCCPQIPRLVATWSETGTVFMWDMSEHLESLDRPGVVPSSQVAPKYSFSGHKEEGYAMAFNPIEAGVFLSGSCDATIRLWKPVEGGWVVEKPIQSHTASVEDIQWQRFGTGSIFASCSVDHSIRFFDTRISTKPQSMISEAHTSDVNVISWSPLQEDFLLSGGDDGCSRIWDMRNLDEPIVHLHFHREPVSSVSWHPTDPAVFAVSSLDDSVTIWDMSVEPAGRPVQGLEVPDQLMFQHMGQTHISEIQWHPRIPGCLITTAEDGFNVFKTFNV